MKHPTSTPSFVSTSGGESQNFSSLEWSPKLDFHLQRRQSSKAQVPHAALLSSNTRRVSTESSGSNSRSSSSSCSSLSESSLSLGFRSYDEIDDAAASAATIEEFDPIISLEALSLRSQRNTDGATTEQTPVRTRTVEKQKPVLVEADKKEQLKVGKQRKCFANGMSRLKYEQELSIESLNFVSSFKKDGLAPKIRTDSHSTPRVEDPIRGQKQPWNFMNTKTNYSVHLTNNSLACEISFPKAKNDCHQQNRTMGKKYTLRMRTNTKPTISINEIEPPRALRSKRQRGGSDFSMANAYSVGDVTNNSSVTTTTTCSRKRRRINRNRAMAADDFDSILSQINTGIL